MSRKEYHKPARGDKFWDGDRIERGLQPNGKIINVYQSYGSVNEVQVQFYDDPDKTSLKDRLVMYYPNQIDGYYENEVMGYRINA